MMRKGKTDKWILEKSQIPIKEGINTLVRSLWHTGGGGEVELSLIVRIRKRGYRELRIQLTGYSCGKIQGN